MDKVKVKGKEFTFALILNDTVKRELAKLPEEQRKKLTILGDMNQEWWCAYVYLDRIIDGELVGETYRDGNTYGVDTNHSYNEDMSMEEKKQDAIKQIILLIKDYLTKIH